MCGIYGFVPKQPHMFYKMSLIADKLRLKLKHRGPDDFGYAFFDKDYKTIINKDSLQQDNLCSMFLGHTRLSILDLTPAGHQPIFSYDKRFCMVYNGEVYNYIEIRSELESLGYKFITNTDTEVVLNALICWREKALSRFIGMFALALFDTFTGKIFCARDAFGIKPFYWTHINGFCFASELPALLCFPDIPHLLNTNNVNNYLEFGIINYGFETLFDNIFSLAPGCFLTIDVNNGNITNERWWTPHFREYSNNLRFPDAVEKLRTLILDLIRLHLRADVPLGVALSGGIDSSTIACCIRHILPDFQINTFSYISNDNKSEEKWVDIVNSHINAIPHKVFVTPASFRNDIKNLIKSQGEPFSSTSIYAQYCIFKEAFSQDIRVILEGQGADEIFAGYYGYPEFFFTTLLFGKKINLLLDMLFHKNLWPISIKFTDLFKNIISNILSTKSKQIIKKILHVSHEPNFSLGRDFFYRYIPQNATPLQKVLSEQLFWHGLPMLLRHGDRNAMSFSIENRVPFCSIELADFCLSLPPEYLISTKGETKCILRAAMRGIVPDIILDRKDKIGFEAPLLNLLLPFDSFYRSILCNYRGDIVNINKEISILNDIISNKRKPDWSIWRKINFILWEKELISK